MSASTASTPPRPGSASGADNAAESRPTPPGQGDGRNFALGISPFCYSDLFDPARLAELSRAFDDVLAQTNPGTAQHFAEYRAGRALSSPEVSELLIRVGEHLGRFVARLFFVEAARERMIAQAADEEIVFRFRRDFITRRVRKRFAPGDIVVADEARYRALESALAPNEPDEELRGAKAAAALLGIHQLFERPSDGAPGALEEAVQFVESLAARLALTPPPGGTSGEPARSDGAVSAARTLLQMLDILERWHGSRIDRVHDASYHQPKTIDPTHHHLVPLLRPESALPEVMEGAIETRRRRDGFGLTDPRMPPRAVMGEIHYCLYCHDREKDSCRIGLHDKSGATKKNPLGIVLDGCPLDERISEAHWLRKSGDAIGALAMITADNPMAPGTGHRICNDCMKSCIYQKQEPVNIPQIETRILIDVLRLPYGFEIYSLLTRWNPLHVERPHPRPYRGHNVLVVGLGPAGYTLSHHLLNEGFGVVGIDGLKIEPLPDDLIGADEWPPRALRDYQEIEDRLDDRLLLGFGGVAEYGITARWDKNFLKVIYLNLARRREFRCYGGVRFGGTLTIEDAWDLGFHHIAIAAGAGRPTIVEMKNNLINGIRQASDFLMALQLTGAYKRSSMANLQVELPALVIGGGLTAIDTGTELAAYYPVQIRKLLERVDAVGEATVFARCDEEERAVLIRMLSHARELREEREKAAPNIPALVAKWGGVHIAYRRSLVESPAYRLNHEEVEKCLEEGVRFVENVTPTEAVPDRFGHVDALKLRRADGSGMLLPARSVMIAAGTSPNIIYEKERPGTFELDEQRKFFRAHKLVWPEGKDEAPRLERAAKGEDGFFTSYRGDGLRTITFYGDNHPRYAGNVVKAMASARLGHREVSRLFRDQPDAGTMEDFRMLLAKLDDELLVSVHDVARLTPTIVEVVVRAKMQSRKFKPGQFFRFQNYEASSPVLDGSRLTMEGIALTGAWVDLEQGLLSLIVLEVGVSSRLCAILKKGDRVVVMGPTGAPTEIPRGENVLLCGGGLGNAVLFSVARAMRAHGNKVVYLAGYRKREDVFKREEIESASDQIVWSVDAGEEITPHRSIDRSFSGTIVQAMHAYASGTFPDAILGFGEVDRIIAIGSDRMMAAVTRARKTVLGEYLRPDHVAIASINSPMQCMMKEVCAQCLQRHVDPLTGQESFVFSCFNQDQKADALDWTNLAARLRQNSLLEKVANLWLDRLLASHELSRV